MMATKRNFLLGHGERLTKAIAPPPKIPSKAHPYTVEEAINRLSGPLQSTSNAITQLNPLVCPNDQAVAVVTLHPSYIAKSYYPDTLLNLFGLRTVGSRQVQITPEHLTNPKQEDAPTIDLFVAGRRDAFANWTRTVTGYKHDLDPAWGDDFRKIEAIHYFKPSERIRNVNPKSNSRKKMLFEVALHAAEDDPDFILRGFQDYLRSLQIQVDLNKRIHTHDLVFVPVEAEERQVQNIEQFSFLRVIREMPRLRNFSPVLRTTGRHKDFPCELPKLGALNPDLKVAVFDGGVPAKSVLDPWVRSLKGSKDISASTEEFLEHGFGVTSALLFGPLKSNAVPDQPYANVDHYQVLDEKTDR